MSELTLTLEEFSKAIRKTIKDGHQLDAKMIAALPTEDERYKAVMALLDRINSAHQHTIDSYELSIEGLKTDLVGRRR